MEFRRQTQTRKKNNSPQRHEAIDHVIHSNEKVFLIVQQLKWSNNVETFQKHRCKDDGINIGVRDEKEQNQQ